MTTEISARAAVESDHATMMTPAKKDDFWMWKPLPAWLKAALVWGPLGIVFSLVCWAAVLLFCDAREEMKSWFQTQKESIAKQSESLQKVSVAFETLVAAQYRLEQRHVSLQASVELAHARAADIAQMMCQRVEQNQELIEQGNAQSVTNTKILQDATDSMSGAKERGEKVVELLKIIAGQDSPKNEQAPPTPNDGGA